MRSACVCVQPQDRPGDDGPKRPEGERLLQRADPGASPLGEAREPRLRMPVQSWHQITDTHALGFRMGCGAEGRSLAVMGGGSGGAASARAESRGPRPAWRSPRVFPSPYEPLAGGFSSPITRSEFPRGRKVGQ